MTLSRREFTTAIGVALGSVPLFGLSPGTFAGHDPLPQALAPFANDPHHDLKAIIVLIGRRRVFEQYFNGDNENTPHDVRSAGKSITSLLFGAALDRGFIHDVTDPVDDYISELRGLPLGRAPLTTLLTMRSGLDADDSDANSYGNETRLMASPHPLQYALSIPVRREPGARYVYNSATAYLVGIVIERSVGRSEQDLAQNALFKPLGIDLWHWEKDPDGHTLGQGNLSLTAREFASVGQMVLDQGVFGGRRVVSKRWIEESLTPRVNISAVDPYSDAYGYFWYSKLHKLSAEEVPVFFASGNGGNKIYIVPSRDLVLAVTSSAYDHGYGQRRSQEILRAVLSATLKRRSPPTKLEQKVIAFVSARKSS